jgi:hypothetical protein
MYPTIYHHHLLITIQFMSNMAFLVIIVTTTPSIKRVKHQIKTIIIYQALVASI